MNEANRILFNEFLFAVLEVVKDLVTTWHQQNTPHGVSIKKLCPKVYEAGWRRKIDGNLHERLYVPQPVPHSQKEEEEDTIENNVEPGETPLETVIAAASASRSASSSASAWLDESRAGNEPAPCSVKLFNTDQTFDSPEEKVAEAYANRWAEEGMARDMLDRITWADYVPNDRRADLYKVFELGMKYVDEFDNSVINRWDMQGVPTHMRVWLAELEWTFKRMMAMNWLPQDCRCPNDKFIRARATGAEGYHDPGNENWDIMVHLLRMWRAVDVNHYTQVIKVPGKEYGERGNKSAAGPVNLRGNIVESLLRHLQIMGSPPREPKPHQVRSCQEYFLGWYDW